jgi:hypothetical protein
MSAWRRRGQRSNLVGGIRCLCIYPICGDDEGAANPGHEKKTPKVQAAPELKVKKPEGLKTRPA